MYQKVEAPFRKHGSITGSGLETLNQKRALSKYHAEPKTCAHAEVVVSRGPVAGIFFRCDTLGTGS